MPDPMTGVSEFAGEVVALEEPALPIRFDPTTLETLGVYGYSDQIQGRISTAHPHRDTARQRHYKPILCACSRRFVTRRAGASRGAAPHSIRVHGSYFPRAAN